MKITQFEIKNFKGIEHTTIKLADGAPGQIATLIGLNESGKTTILEAISHFITEDKDISSLVGTVQQKSSLQDLIPKDKKAAFTGRISIKALIELSDDDVKALSEMFYNDLNLVLDSNILRSVTVDRSYRFEDSSHKESNTFWTITFGLKSSRAKNYTKHSGNSDEDGGSRKSWLAGIRFLGGRLPKIVYFPTFLFDFPDRIYLEKDESEINLYYKQVIQDVMDSQVVSSPTEKLSVQKHIVDRIIRMRGEHSAVDTFLGYIFGRDEKKQIDAVLNSVSNEMSRVIFGSWNQILNRRVTGKRVQIDWSLDAEKENAPYLELSIFDGQATYSLSERSLGFRWFFSFLLFTQFRKNRRDQGPTIFLFDEPAANLHSRAQMKLLESFSKIVSDATYIIYSTHSHYMVNPLWLEKAYIIENKSTNYDSDDDVDSFSIQKTDVKAIRYKTFVGCNPTKTTYFQPVLDALDVSFSPLLRSANALVIEGKNDYHALSYFSKKMLDKCDFDLFPGNGAGDSETLISLLRGWGVRFRLLLDDDRAGRDAKKKYTEDLFLTASEVITLGEISGDMSGKEFEKLYADDVREAVKDFFSITKISKKHFALYFQELLLSGKVQNFPETEKKITPLIQWLQNEFRST